MAMEKPIVGTNVGGIPELVNNGQTGYVVEKGNLAMAVEAILSILSDNNLARKMGQLGRKTIRERYSWSIIAKKVLNVYSEMLVD